MVTRTGDAASEGARSLRFGSSEGEGGGGSSGAEIAQIFDLPPSGIPG